MTQAGAAPSLEAIAAEFAALAGEWQRAARGGGPAALEAARRLASRAASLWSRAAKASQDTALGDLAARLAGDGQTAPISALLVAAGRWRAAAAELASRDQDLLAAGAAEYARQVAASTVPAPAEELLALWIGIQDDLRSRAMAGTDYVERHADLVNAAVAVVAALQASVAGTGTALALAPRSELDALAARVAALEAGAARPVVRRRRAPAMQAARSASHEAAPARRRRGAKQRP